MKTCPQCNSNNVMDERKTCPYCLYSFEKAEAASEVTAKVEKSTKEKKVEEKKEKVKIKPAPTPVADSTFASAPAAATAPQTGGAKVPPPYVPPTPKEKPKKEKKPAVPKAQKKGKKGLIVAIVILLLFVGLVFGAVKSFKYMVETGFLEEMTGLDLSKPDTKTSGSESQYNADSWMNAIESSESYSYTEELPEVAVEASEEWSEPIVESEEAEIPFEDSYMLPDSDVRLLTEEDVYGLTKEEARIARNELYARHGRMFRSEDLQEYFNAKNWYEPIYTPDDWQEAWLSEVECYNRDFLVNYEKTLN